MSNRLKLSRAGVALQSRFLHLFLTLIELLGDALAAHLAVVRVHHNKLAVIIGEARGSLDL